MFKFDSAILCGILRPPSAEAAAKDPQASSQLLYCPHPDTIIQVRENRSANANAIHSIVCITVVTVVTVIQYSVHYSSKQ